MTIVIVEDQQVIREVLSTLCRAEGHSILGEADDGRKAIATILEQQPEVVVLDLELPLLDGLEVIKAIRKAGCHPRILLVSGHCDEFTVYRVDKLRVHGFLDKGMVSLLEIKKALQAISEGSPFFSSSYQQARARLRSDLDSFAKLLSEREIEVAAQIADGMDDHEIGDILDISDATVKKHRFNIMRKLSLASRSDLRKYAESHGLSRGFRAVAVWPPRTPLAGVVKTTVGALPGLKSA